MKRKEKDTSVLKTTAVSHSLRILSLGLATLLLAAEVVLIAGEEVQVGRFEQRGKYFYMIKDFALRNPDNYLSAVAPSACWCRRRCQVLVDCRAVSIVPLDKGQVECRTTNKPGVLTRWEARPELMKTPGALHILETDANLWDQPEIDGMFYQIQNHPFSFSLLCNNGYEPATAKTLLQYEIFKRKKDSVQDDLCVGLYKYFLRYEPMWIASTTVPPLSQIPYNTSELPATLQPGKDWYYYVFRKVNGSLYEFASSYHYTCLALCQANKLKLTWL